ncbi:hypothetical protein FD21_GL001887 [Liquorilactobacillus vini DSM 20605]|uniref:Uncharacterized protein n=2 Tax=Liquorilactobacillus vini TaxID=238015 RepID=A0A0R2CNA8_9LACO|nr:hypothetical protein FD21_GL001887 [Liquorilactobacillus vini DSM 20605]
MDLNLHNLEEILMIWLWLHLLAAVILFGVILITVIKKKALATVVMTARIDYLIAIISGIMLFDYAWSKSPVLAVLKALAALVVIGLCEILFKRVSQLTGLGRGLILMSVIVLIIFGLLLSAGYPLISLV